MFDIEGIISSPWGVLHIYRLYDQEPQIIKIALEWMAFSTGRVRLRSVLNHCQNNAQKLASRRESPRKGFDTSEKSFDPQEFLNDAQRSEIDYLHHVDDG